MVQPVYEWPEELRATIESEFYIRPKTMRSTSPYTDESTVYAADAQRFIANLTFPTLRGPQARELSGFIVSLRGQKGLLRLVDFHRMRPGFDEENKTVNKWGDSDVFGILPPFIAADENREAGSNDLLVTGYGAAFTRAARPGDRFEVRPSGVAAAHGHYYEIISNSHTNAAGETRLFFEPGLRAGVQSGDQIVLRFPTSVFRLASDGEGVLHRSAPGNLATLGVAAAEVMPEEQL